MKRERERARKEKEERKKQKKISKICLNEKWSLNVRLFAAGLLSFTHKKKMGYNSYLIHGRGLYVNSKSLR